MENRAISKKIEEQEIDDSSNENKINKNFNIKENRENIINDGEDIINDDTINEIPHNLLEESNNSIAEDATVEVHSLIIVTGFGPFIGHELVNASWEAVRILPDNFQYNNHKYKIEKKLVSVEYAEVDQAVDEIWNKNPVLVVHCGVHGGAKSIYLESLAYNNKFNRPDFARKRLGCPTVCLEKNGTCCERICTKLNVKEIAKNVNEIADRNDSLTVSNDVGNYLCGYIYLKSLDVDCNRTLFIHVPPIDKPFSSNETSKVVFNVIQECIKQIEIMDEAEETCAA